MGSGFFLYRESKKGRKGECLGEFLSWWGGDGEGFYSGGEGEGRRGDILYGYGGRRGETFCMVTEEGGDNLKSERETTLPTEFHVTLG